MKIIGIIPSRYGSTRFPGKPLAYIQGKSMIQRVYEQCKKCISLTDVIIATDDRRIYNHVLDFKGKVMMSSKEHQTGVAGIHVDSNTGQNAITVVRGAPASFTKDEIDISIIKKSKIFLTQLEIPIDVTLHCLKVAKESGLINILNPAPACKLDKEFFSLADYFTPNEAEAEFYTGVRIKNESDAKESAKKLLTLGLKKVIITLGEKGLFYSDGKEEIYIKALPFKKVEDTTGAGDAFNGGLAYALSKNKSIIYPLPKEYLIKINRIVKVNFYLS